MPSWKDALAAAAQAAGFNPQVNRFFFLRHGQTEYNRQKIVQGWVDIPLNSTGEAQAASAAQALSAYKAPLTHIVASPLGRAHTTARIVAQSLGLPITSLDDRLRERCFGAYENFPEPKHTAWMKIDQGAEAHEVFANRIVAGLNAALTTGVPLVVAHGGTRRVLLMALGLDVGESAMGNAVPLDLRRRNGLWSVVPLQTNQPATAAADI